MKLRIILKKLIRRFDEPITLKDFLSIKKVNGGIDSIIGNSCYINNKGKITIGEKVLINSFPNGSMHQTAISTYFENAEVIIGSNCKLNGLVIHCNEKVIIGDDCMFGPGTVLCDNDSHRISIDPIVRNQRPESAPIILANNVWIGMNCIILKGVTIGENSIVAAGAVVTKNVPENCIFGGNPARFIKNVS